MRCTGKEQLTCREEKMGGEGCFYAKIEELLKKLDKEEQELQNSISDEEREEYSDANISYQLMNIEIRRSVLQELLKN